MLELLDAARAATETAAEVGTTLCTLVLGGRPLPGAATAVDGGLALAEVGKNTRAEEPPGCAARSGSGCVGELGGLFLSIKAISSSVKP